MVVIEEENRMANITLPSIKQVADHMSSTSPGKSELSKNPQPSGEDAAESVKRVYEAVKAVAGVNGDYVWWGD
jgi:hypothetical protein